LYNSNLFRIIANLHNQILMKIHTKVRYGLRAMLEIAGSDNPNGVLQKDIAKNQNISLSYLDHIISALKAKGLVTNVNGKHSGYKLLKKQDEITMKDIYTAFEPITILDCLNNESFCEKTCNCLARDYWDELKQQIEETLTKKTLGQLLYKYQNKKIITI